MEEKFKKQIEELDPDIKHYFYQQGISAGIKHTTSSPETIKRFEHLEKIMADNQKVMSSIHDAIYGIEGRGGIWQIVDTILVQATKTNGRVNVLEKKDEQRSGSIKTIGIVASSLLIIVPSIFSYFYVKFQHVNEQVITLIAQQE